MTRPRPEDYRQVLELASEGGPRRLFLGPGSHTVGSARDCEIQLTAAGVSRRHARLEILEDGGALVEDLGSKNGTFVADRRVRRAAIGESGRLRFGSVEALLRPADPSGARVLLAPPKGASAAAASGAALVGQPSTLGLQPLERLAESLREILPDRLTGRRSPGEIADALARRWLSVLPVGRVEFLHASEGSEPTVIAAASTQDRLARDTPVFTVDGPGDWTLALRTPNPDALSALRPLLELTLAALAAPRGSRGGEGPGTFPTPLATEPPPGLGPETAEVYRRCAKIARGEVPILVLGESGVGKEVLARWIHAASRRAEAPFLAVNCAALPAELLEAELFGIERGVATGVDARPGILERADGGTVFLDELGDMPAEVQAKVLRVLESTRLYRVGGRRPVEIDVRFVAATHQDLPAKVSEGTFRLDLYHRLAAFEATLAPLRRRRQEIPGLAARFFHSELEALGLRSPGITRDALGALVSYRWPGNVRELKNEIAKAALLLEPGQPLDRNQLSRRIRDAAATGKGPPLTLAAATEAAEREAFAVALEAAGGDPGGAMELLGVSRTTYYRKLKELEPGS